MQRSSTTFFNFTISILFATVAVAFFLGGLENLGGKNGLLAQSTEPTVLEFENKHLFYHEVLSFPELLYATARHLGHLFSE
ncbi:MAG: hypothetical protein Q8P52_02410 [bacterium]|nr:hypothetical protein [bacterium]